MYVCIIYYTPMIGVISNNIAIAHQPAAKSPVHICMYVCFYACMYICIYVCGYLNPLKWWFNYNYSTSGQITIDCSNI